MTRLSHFVKFLLLILLTTQTASFICGAHCAQHSHSDHHSMDHCAMPTPNHPALETCANLQTHCATDLFVRTPEQIKPPALHVEPLAELTHFPTSTHPQTATTHQRSTPASASLVAPLRI